MADVRWAVAYVPRAVADVRWAVAKVRGAVASEAKGDRSKGEQCAEDETGEKDAFHGAVWLVVYSSSDGVSTKGTESRAI